jgi:hypothetical protein
MAHPSKTVFLKSMKNLLLLITLMAGSLVAGAQKVYFMYLQSDNGAPFYVRLGEKVHSSSASGYVILSNLKDSSYLLQVGFPGQNAESRFPVTVGAQDRGYVLKQVSGTWNLFDLQDLTLIKALAAIGPTDEENKQLLAAADPFTRLLVQASDDMTLLQAGPSAPAPQTIAAAAAPIPEKEEPLPAAIMPAPINSALAEAKPVQAVFTPAVNVSAQTTVKRDTVPVSAGPMEITEPAFARSVVTRRSESSTTEGFGLVFVDRLGESADTIRLLIPNPKTTASKTPVQEAPPVASTTTTSTTEIKADTAPASKTEAPVKDSLSASVANIPVAAAGADACKAQAEEKDFLKLRRNMAAAEDEGGMIVVARKNFKARCYTTEQVRYLSALFLTALGKYNFFETAKGHVSDPALFSTLGTELKDEYFSKRFQELTK